MDSRWSDKDESDVIKLLAPFGDFQSNYPGVRITIIGICPNLDDDARAEAKSRRKRLPLKANVEMTTSELGRGANKSETGDQKLDFPGIISDEACARPPHNPITPAHISSTTRSHQFVEVITYMSESILLPEHMKLLRRALYARGE